MPNLVDSIFRDTDGFGDEPGAVSFEIFGGGSAEWAHKPFEYEGIADGMEVTDDNRQTAA